MTSKPTIPKFESEAQEAQWWDDHREETASWMESAVAEGRTSSLAGILSRKQGGSTPTVSIRIDTADISRARALAEKRGLRYQTYLKMLLHEALEKEDQRLAG